MEEEVEEEVEDEEEEEVPCQTSQQTEGWDASTVMCRCIAN